MTRFKFTFDKDAEQLWLNDYCREGWAMTGFFVGLVTFVPCQPGEYIYQIDLLPGSGLRANDYEGYVIFMHEMGVEVVQRWGRWVYLRKRAEDGPFEVYTDLDSQIQLYQRIRKMFLWALVIETLCLPNNVASAFRIENVFYRSLIAALVLLFAGLLRAIWQCTRRIEDLEQARQGFREESPHRALGIAWVISLAVLGVASNLLLAAGALSLPDGLTRALGVLDLAALAVLTFTTVRLLMAKKRS